MAAIQPHRPVLSSPRRRTLLPLVLVAMGGCQQTITSAPSAPPLPAPAPSASHTAPAPAAPLLWSHDTGGHVAPTPLVSPDGQTVFCVSPQTGTLGALRAINGQSLWSVKTESWLFPPRLSKDGSTLFVLADGLRAYHARDGKPKWERPTQESFIALAHHPGDDRLFVASNHDAGNESRESPPPSAPPPGPNHLRAFEPEQGQPLWAFQREASERFSDAIAVSPNGALVYAATDRALYALDASTGALRWEFAARNAGRPLRAGLSRNGAALYLSASEPPFGATKSHLLLALDAMTGAPRWRFATSSPLSASPIESLDSSLVYASTEEGLLHAIVTADGKESWRFRANASLHELVFSTRHASLFVGSYDRRFYALDTLTGAQRWSYPTGGVLYTQPALSPDESTVYVGSQDGSLYALRTVQR
jgi:outer membrane protein assembly factor BamB